MFESKSTNSLTINLEGLNLSDEHLERINKAVQKAVMTELGSIDLNYNRGGLLSGFDPRLRGIWYIPNLEKLGFE